MPPSQPGVASVSVYSHDIEDCSVAFATVGDCAGEEILGGRDGEKWEISASYARVTCA